MLYLLNSFSQITPKEYMRIIFSLSLMSLCSCTAMPELFQASDNAIEIQVSKEGLQKVNNINVVIKNSADK